jgi:hypothetical protein
MPLTVEQINIKREIAEVKAEMKRRNIRRISCFNGGLSDDERRFNTQLFNLTTAWKKAEKL